MADRKTLTKSKILLDPQKPCSDDCDRDLHPPPLPPPPPPTSSSAHSLSPFLIFMFCGLAVSFAFICYLTLTARYRRRQRRPVEINSDETHEDFVNEDLGPVVHHHPIWLINTIGLDQSEIESIQVFKYKKGEGLIEGTDCSVCLSEFEDDESLRLLPKCSHAFHVACIDTWLRSHKNCPLCRAPIIKNTVAQVETITTDSNPIEPQEINPVEDSETVDDHVIEVEINGESEKSSRTHEVESVETRRSISMDESSASMIHLNGQETYSTDQSIVQSMKQNGMPKSGKKLRGSSSSVHTRSRSSTFGNSLRKTSSFTIKCPQNRSY